MKIVPVGRTLFVRCVPSMQGEAGSGLSETVRKYRQSVFKLNYKIKKNASRPRISRHLHLPAIPATAAARMAAVADSQPSPLEEADEEELSR